MNSHPYLTEFWQELIFISRYKHQSQGKKSYLKACLIGLSIDGVLLILLSERGVDTPTSALLKAEKREKKKKAPWITFNFFHNTFRIIPKTLAFVETTYMWIVCARNNIFCKGLYLFAKLASLLMAVCFGFMAYQPL